MNFQHLCTSVSIASLLAMGLAAGASAQTALTQTTTASPTLLGTGSLTVTDNAANANPVTVQQITSASLARFDPSLGVLTGVSGTLNVVPGTNLAVSRTVNTNQFNGTGTLRALWNFGTTPATSIYSGDNGLAQLVVNRNVPSLSTSTFSQMAYTAPAADRAGFVGVGNLSTSITTSLLALKDPTANGTGSVTSTLSAPLNAALSLQYSYLTHARGSFSNAAAIDSLSMTLGTGGGSFNVFALGNANTTRLDLLNVTCTGACGQFSLTLPLADLAAGSQATGQVTVIGQPAGGTAVYQLTLGDDTSVGVASSLQSRQMTVSITAVPEPATYAMWLAGLLAMGHIVRRRRPD
ncbi:PEP-CTERM sorting domain-containing protein [Ideonella sp. A 288]|uniref:PEP-CTERM sorting domain-containing protein n=1 Tax=Ideonella sp. A 288 TaxID=1962181 RepID=UPI000B4BACCA|nr:PEP-CTERM sorting domain-containing protein [Ideonella sp. A 288]